MQYRAMQDKSAPYQPTFGKLKKGLPPEKASDFRNLVVHRFSQNQPCKLRLARCHLLQLQSQLHCNRSFQSMQCSMLQCTFTNQQPGTMESCHNPVVLSCKHPYKHVKIRRVNNSAPSPSPPAAVAVEAPLLLQLCLPLNSRRKQLRSQVAEGHL